MAYLLDTNVLLRLSDRRDPRHPTVRSALRTLRSNGETLYFTSQNAIECWNVATRPVERNGLGLGPTDADRMLRLFERLFPMLSDIPAIYPEWCRLVRTYQVSGVEVHDGRFAARNNNQGCCTDSQAPYPARQHH